MNVSVECPRCRGLDTELLSTTNEWKYHCKKCDVRFNETSMEMPGVRKLFMEVFGNEPSP